MQLTLLFDHSKASTEIFTICYRKKQKKYLRQGQIVWIHNPDEKVRIQMNNEFLNEL